MLKIVSTGYPMRIPAAERKEEMPKTASKICNLPGTKSKALFAQILERNQTLASVCMAMLLIAVGFGVVSPDAAAVESINKTVLARVTIAKWSKVEVLGGAALIHVTEADIRRGYLDLREPTKLLVASNALGNYFAEIVPPGGFVKALQVSVDGRRFAFGAAGGGVSLRGTTRAPSRDSFEIQYRIFFSENVTPGTYAWTPSVTVTIL